MVTKTYFCLPNWGICVTLICYKALDLRPRGLVPIICKVGVVMRDAQEEDVFIILWSWARGMWEKQTWSPFIFVCMREWNWSACSVEVMNVPAEAVWSAFPSDIKLWSLGSSDWVGSGAVLLSVCPILDGPMHCLIAAKIGKNHRRVFFCLAYLCFWWEKLLWSMSLGYKYYYWPHMALSEELPSKTRRLVFDYLYSSVF